MSTPFGRQCPRGPTRRPKLLGERRRAEGARAYVAVAFGLALAVLERDFDADSRPQRLAGLRLRGPPRPLNVTNTDNRLLASAVRTLY